MAASTYYQNYTGMSQDLPAVLDQAPTDWLATIDAEPFIDYNLGPDGFLYDAPAEIQEEFRHDAEIGIRFVEAEIVEDQGYVRLSNWLSETYDFAIPLDEEIVYWYESFW